MSLLPGGNPSRVVFAQDLQDPWSILHAYRESYILGVGPGGVPAGACGADTRLRVPRTFFSQNERVF